MRNLYFAFYFFIICSTHAQENIYRIALPVNSASHFKFIHNNSGIGCLFLDLGNSYCIMLVDSSYQVLAEFSDQYYTSIAPVFIGSVTDNDRFELYFKRVEENVLFVLTIDIKQKKLTRIKDYKIADQVKEKVIYRGSNLLGNEMITISIGTNNSLIFRNHRIGLKTEKNQIQLSGEDYKFLKEGDCLHLLYWNDTLKMIYAKNDIISLKKGCRAFTCFSKTGLYQTADLNFDSLELNIYKRIQYLDTNWEIIFLSSENDLWFFDALSGNLLYQTNIDFNSIIKDDSIRLFKYSFECKFDIFQDTKQHTYLYGVRRKQFLETNCLYDFFSDSVGSYLQITSMSIQQNSSTCTYSIRAVVPFDWDKKQIDLTRPLNISASNEYISYEIDICSKQRVKVSNYFIGFNNQYLLGYVLKSSKEFVIEKINF